MGYWDEYGNWNIEPGDNPGELPVTITQSQATPDYTVPDRVADFIKQIGEEDVEPDSTPAKGAEMTQRSILDTARTFLPGGEPADWGGLLKTLAPYLVGAAIGGTAGTIIGGVAGKFIGSGKSTSTAVAVRAGSSNGAAPAGAISSIAGVPLVGPGVAEPSAAYVRSRWETRVYDNQLGYVKLNFYALTNGVIAMYHNERGYWRWWRPKKSIVVGPNLRLNNVLSAAKKIDNVLLKIESRTKKFRRRVGTTRVTRRK